jgi:hypothetical protein
MEDNNFKEKELIDKNKRLSISYVANVTQGNDKID